MVYAEVNGVKTKAKPELKGRCPMCEGEVQAKCGEINVWHWAHKKNSDCDSWHEPETEWHINWKSVFGIEHSEIVISKDNRRHIADILTKDNVVIEIQNSPIQKSTILERELFYGERMLWIINGKGFEHNFKLGEYNPSYEELQVIHRNYPFDKWSEMELLLPKRFTFEWSHARKSWKDVQRNVFIDFGDEHLHHIKEGMGQRIGWGKYVEKKCFIEKYGGDISVMNMVVNQ